MKYTNIISSPVQIIKGYIIALDYILILIILKEHSNVKYLKIIYYLLSLYHNFY